MEFGSRLSTSCVLKEIKDAIEDILPKLTTNKRKQYLGKIRLENFEHKQKGGPSQNGSRSFVAEAPALSMLDRIAKAWNTSTGP